MEQKELLNNYVSATKGSVQFTTRTLTNILHPNDDKAYYQLGNSVSINVVKAVAQEAIIKTLYCTQERTDKSKPTLAQSLNYVPDPNGRGSAMPFPCA